MKISELIKHLADVLVTDGDVNVYLETEDMDGGGQEEVVEDLLVGRRKVIITSKDRS